jgi:hypothetical protein
VDCYAVLKEITGIAVNREDFIERMKQAGYETKWSDSRKYITFTDANGNKIRNSNLEKTFKEPLFGKEALENGFKSNLERANVIRAAKQARRFAADTGFTADSPNAEIEKLHAVIGKSRTAVESDERSRANRIADSQSRNRQRNRDEKPRVIGNSRGRAHEER